MHREINLREYVPCGPYTLTAHERRALEAVKAGISIAPDSELDNAYMLTASSTVGAFEAGGLSVLIEPKIGIPRLLALASYAMGLYRPQDDSDFNFAERNSLPDIQALALTRAGAASVLAWAAARLPHAGRGPADRARAHPLCRPGSASIRHRAAR